MASAKQESATYHMMNLLREWDSSTKEKRRTLLRDFITQHQGKSGPEIDFGMAQMGSLFLARISVWLKLTYMNGTCLTEQLQALHIFLSSSSSHSFLLEFLEHGGILCLLEVISLKQAKDLDKCWSLRVLQSVADSGTKYKEIICECYGIRAVAECLAKSKAEETQEAARNLIESLADGNPRYVGQVYKGLIGVLPCNSPKAQRMAVQTLRVVQPLVRPANKTIVQRCLSLLETLHMEVQSATIELIRDLMAYEVQEDLLRALVIALRPTREVTLDSGHDGADGEETATTASHMSLALPSYIKQAAAAKCIKILAIDNNELCEKLIQLRVVHNLLYAMGNMEYADSQRQASMTLDYFCRNYSIVAEHVKEAMGSSLYQEFVKDPEALYVHMTAIQADVLISNKVNIPGNLDRYEIYAAQVKD